MKCVWILVGICAVIFAASEMVSAGSASVEASLDPETAELLERYVKARRISPFGYMGGLPWLPQPPKRNSELINSILGLPKVMNDAGRKK